jgi:hypothetical protein
MVVWVYACCSTVQTAVLQATCSRRSSATAASCRTKSLQSLLLLLLSKLVQKPATGDAHSIPSLLDTLLLWLLHTLMLVALHCCLVQLLSKLCSRRCGACAQLLL